MVTENTEKSELEFKKKNIENWQNPVEQILSLLTDAARVM